MPLPAMSTHSAQHANFFATCNSLFCVVGLEGSFRQTNAAWESLLGYTWSEIQDKHFLDLVHEEDREATDKALKQLSEETDSLVFTNRFRHHNGKYLDFIWQATSSMMEFGFYAVGIDVSDYKAEVQKTARLQMQESNTIMSEKYADLQLFYEAQKERLNILEKLLQGLEEGVLLDHVEHGLSSLNERAEAILGIMPGEEDFEQIWHGLEKTVETGEVKEFIYRRLGARKNLLRLLGRAYLLIRKGETRPYARMLVFRDISERVSLRQQSQNLKERFDLILSALDEAIMDWDLRGNRAYCSPAWLKMLNSEEDREASYYIQRWQSKIYPADYTRVELELRHFLEGRIPYYENVHRLQQNDGTYTWIFHRALAQRDSGKKAFRVLHVFNDLEQLRKAEDALKKIAFLQKNQFNKSE